MTDGYSPASTAECADSLPITCGQLAAKDLALRDSELGLLSATSEAAAHVHDEGLSLGLDVEALRDLLVESLQHLFALSPTESYSGERPPPERVTHLEHPRVPVTPDDSVETYGSWLTHKRPSTGFVGSELLLTRLAERQQQHRLLDGHPFPEQPIDPNHNCDDGFALLIRIFENDLRSFVRKRCSYVAHLVDEILQDTLFAFYRNYLHSDCVRRWASISPLRNMLFLIARRRSADAVRREAGERELFDVLFQEMLSQGSGFLQEMVDSDLDAESEVPDPRRVSEIARRELRAYIREKNKLPAAWLGFAFPSREDQLSLLEGVSPGAQVYAWDYYFQINEQTGRPYRNSELAEKWNVTRPAVNDHLNRASKKVLPRVMTLLNLD